MPTRFLGLRRLRLVTVRVLARLRLANEYYDNRVHLCVEKKIMGYSSRVRPALEVIFKIPIVIKPAKAIPKRTISDSIGINHNKDSLYLFSFD